MGRVVDALHTLNVGHAAKCLAALYNHALSPQTALPLMFHKPNHIMTEVEAEELLDANPHRTYFDYIAGRAIKCDVGKDPLDLRLYDRDNARRPGHRAGAEALDCEGCVKCRKNPAG